MWPFEIKLPLGSQYRSRPDYPFDADGLLAGSWSAYTPRPRARSWYLNLHCPRYPFQHNESLRKYYVEKSTCIRFHELSCKIFFC